ncbi:MAG: hypothetical protein KBG07_07250 [Elusimicrobia bacterium]|nr:hypothetical protein [Elusimicrobiota bacterium]
MPRTSGFPSLQKQLLRRLLEQAFPDALAEMVLPLALFQRWAGAVFHGDQAFLQALLRTSELAGFSLQWKGRRFYATAPLVGDAILLAMKSVTSWTRLSRQKESVN